MKKILYLLLPLLSLTAVFATEQQVAPLGSPKCEYAQGKVGRCLKMTSNLKLQYPESLFSLPGGTIEIWVNPEEQTPAGKQIFLLSHGTNNPSWFFWGFDQNNTNFLARSKKDAKSFHYYSSVRIPFVTPAKSWTHFALVWCNVEPGESLVQLYVNGKVVIERFDQTLAKEFGGAIGIGHNTAGTAQPSFNGLLDELRISNQPRRAAEIMASYQAGIEGRPLTADDKTLLYVNFENTLKGVSNAKVLPLDQLKTIGDSLLDELVGD